MPAHICIRREDKNEWERRTPLIPAHVKQLLEQGIQVHVQTSPIRAYRRQEYEQAGATIIEGLSECPIILAIKEVPPALLQPHKTYIFFSHTIKGQAYNMPMLQKLLDLGCQLIDYEKIVDEQGRRVVFFGDYAGRAGMIDTLWALGQRLAWENIDTPLREIQPAHQYTDLEAAKQAIQRVGQQIAKKGLIPAALTPLICGFAGYGNVSRGAQEIYDLLPVQEIDPDDLATCQDRDPHHVFKVVFKEQHMVTPIQKGTTFELQDYYDHPEKYRGQFERYVPYLTLLVNGIYWSARYPRLVTQDYLKELFSQDQAPKVLTCPPWQTSAPWHCTPGQVRTLGGQCQGSQPKGKLRVIGDISCDAEGAIECNLRATDPGNPIYVYDPLTGKTQDGHQGRGVVVLAVDNLPCELPRESSTHFSNTLLPFVSTIARADYGVPFDQSDLPPIIKRAVIVWQGQLTPAYRYLQEYL